MWCMLGCLVLLYLEWDCSMAEMRVFLEEMMGSGEWAVVHGGKECFSWSSVILPCLKHLRFCPFSLKSTLPTTSVASKPLGTEWLFQMFRKVSSGCVTKGTRTSSLSLLMTLTPGGSLQQHSWIMTPWLEQTSLVTSVWWVCFAEVGPFWTYFPLKHPWFILKEWECH